MTTSVLEQSRMDTYIPRLLANDPQLTSLDLSARMVTDLTATLIAKALKSNTRMHSLNLSSNDVSNVGAAAIAQALESNGTLRCLDLSENHNIDDVTGLALLILVKRFDSLSEVKLTGTQCPLSTQDEIKYYCSLNAHPNMMCRLIKRLGLDDADTHFHFALEQNASDVKVYTDDSIHRIVSAMARSPWIRSISLNACCRADSRIAILCETLASHPSLTDTSLASNMIGTHGAQSICAALSSFPQTKLRRLDLTDNEIGDQGVQHFLQLLMTNHSLEIIVVDKNNVSPVYAVRLQSALALNSQPSLLKQLLPRILASDNTITSINLRGSDTGTARGYVNNMGAKVLAKALNSNRCVTSVDLSHNHIGVDGAVALSETMRLNTVITTLLLNHNEGICDEGARHIRDAIRKGNNNAIQKLTLENCGVNMGFVDEIAFACQLNRHALPLKNFILDPTGFLALSKDGNTLDFQTVNTLNAESIGLLRNALVKTTIGFRIKSMNFMNSPIGDDGVRVLCSWLNTDTTVDTLNFTNCGLSDEAVHYLLRCLTVNTVLTTIRIDNNPNIKVQCREALLDSLILNTFSVKSVISKLRANDPGMLSLDLSASKPKIGDEACKLVAMALAGNSIVTSLNLARNEISTAGVEALAAVLKDPHTRLRELNLDGNDVGVEAATSLADALIMQATLISLSLSDNHIHDGGAKALWSIVSSQQNTVLCEIRVEKNNVSDRMACMVRAISHLNAQPDAFRSIVSNLTTLDPEVMSKSVVYTNGGLGDSGLAILATLLQDCPLTDLDLAKNVITEKGLAALAEALPTSHIVRVNLSSNTIRDVAALLIPLKKCKVQYLDLSGNPCHADVSVRQHVLSLTILNRYPGAQPLRKVFDDFNDGDGNDVRAIELCDMALGDDALDALLYAVGSAPLSLRATTTTLDLRKNNLTDLGCQYLTMLLPLLPNVSNIFLSTNKIGTLGVRALCTCLEENKCVVQFAVEDNPIDAVEGKYAIDTLRCRVESNLSSAPVTQTPTDVALKARRMQNAAVIQELRSEEVDRRIMESALLGYTKNKPGR